MHRIKRVFFAFLIIMCSVSCSKHTSQSLYTAQSIEECGIVVRLSDRSAQAEALRKNGQDKRADYLIEHDYEENKKTVALFSAACAYTDIYFIYRSDTEKLLKGDQTIFLDADLKRTEAISMECNDFFIIDKGEVDEDSEVQRANDWIVKDRNLKPAERPFPWRVNYPLDCLGKGKKTEIDCLCFKIKRYIDKTQ